ncbi:hypothetical protein, partial [Cronobacter dublinensis]|uniref:hypothetical protein n=1 Tax=Cronobacter dublinensis TaxID=413497 RepID=UPI003AF43B46
FPSCIQPGVIIIPTSIYLFPPVRHFIGSLPSCRHSALVTVPCALNNPAHLCGSLKYLTRLFRAGAARQ